MQLDAGGRGKEKAYLCALLVLVLVALVCSPTHAKSALVGTTSASFLKLGTQAQAMGVGEAVTALSDGIAFVGYNPSAVRLSGITLTATHTALYEGVSLEEVALGIPFGKKAGMVIRGNGVMFDKTDRTDLTGNKTGTFGSSSYAAGAGLYGHIGNLSLGIFGKAIQQQIDAFKSSTVAADVGMRYLTPLPGVSLGVSVLNVGRPVKFLSQEDELPRAVRAGIGYDYGFLKLGLDVVQYSDQTPFLAAGAEITLFGGLKLRGGYGDKSELSSPFKAGIGFRFSSLDLSYAYIPGEVFGAAHHMTLTIR